MKLSSSIAAAVLALAASGVAVSANAETPWQRHHPRQSEVLRRDARERSAIREERREGDISGAKARRLLSEDRAIAREDHAMARADGGYITRADQRQMNRQENRVARQLPN
ncbi:MAG: hypothetical protein JOZ26_18110 [Hyphomicrobiales bacterium]|nr:hypothetical protein [Hyphomicrobiales bacterium]